MRRPDDARMKHFISLNDLDQTTLSSLLDDADDLRDAWYADAMPKRLAGLRIALWFFDAGFRNRVAFEIGAEAMGAAAAFIPGALGERESPADVAGYLANWFSGVVIRTRHHEGLAEYAAASPIPVINARTDHTHPCEVLGDLQFIRRERGSLEGLKVAFVGEDSNLCYPWFEAAAALPMSVTQVCPEGYSADIEDLQFGAVGELRTSHDLDVVRGVDVIYTDCWPRGSSTKDAARIARDFAPYRITEALLDRSKAGTIFLPCPPVTRGEEVDDRALRHRACRVVEAKEFLLHAQNALMSHTFAGTG